MKSPAERHIEDIVVGESIVTGTIRITPESLREFAGIYDPQPMHLDSVAAADSIFGRVVASGWQTLALTMKLMVEARPFGSTPLVGVAVDDIRFRQPVDPGTTIRARAEITGVRNRSRGGGGFITLLVSTDNVDSGDVVLTQKWTLLLPSRTASTAETSPQ